MFVFVFFKQKTAYALRISDWSSDVCSSDLLPPVHDIGDRLGLLAESDRQEAAGQRIEGAAVADLARLQDAADAPDDLGGGEAQRLVDDNPPVDRRLGRQQDLVDGDRKSTRRNSNN